MNNRFHETVRKTIFLTAVFLAVGAYGVGAENWKIESTNTLPNIPLSGFLRQQLGISVDDHNIRLGGTGSDLWHGPDDDRDIYWMITDRGPNGEIGNPARRTFPVPLFTPLILKVRANAGQIEILQTIPITGTGPAAGGVTGLSNTIRDEEPYDCAAKTRLSLNPNGLDTEGFVRTANGTFWAVEEYGPSLVKIAADGKVLKRFVPRNLRPATVAPGYPTEATLPEILGKRKVNRGFEGIGVTPRQDTLYAVVQSPLLNPDAATGNASRNIRIIGFNIATERVISEYVYRLQPVTEYGQTAPSEMKVSALAMLDERRVLVLERTDLVARIYRADLAQATNILGSQWDRPDQLPTLESLDETQLRRERVTVLPKELVLELDSAQGFPQKLEGLAILDDGTIAVANDNDYGIAEFDTTGQNCRLIDSGRKSQLLVIRRSSGDAGQ